MPDDDRLKSAYELAMERLQAADRSRGVEKSKPLTARQKEEIARLRRETDAKLAELEILFRKRREAAAHDPKELAEAEQNYETDRRRARSSLEAAIDRIRN